MGKSLRSKRQRKNRNLKRTRYGPKELEALKAAVQFEYNAHTESSHLSIFHDVMNGPPPVVPGLEEGSKLQRAHLTEMNATAERHDGYLEVKLPKTREVATHALTKSMDLNDDKDKQAKTKDSESMEEVRIFNEKTYQDQYGNYPTWYNKKKLLSKLHGKRVAKQKLKRKVKKLGKQPQRNTDVVMNDGFESD